MPPPPPVRAKTPVSSAAISTTAAAHPQETSVRVRQRKFQATNRDDGGLYQ
jgi:hypothetical protein